MEGQQYAGQFGPAAKVTAVNTYEWLTGGFFLVHRLEGHMDDHAMACIEIIGHDASSQSYPTHAFYNDGNAKVWQLRERGGTWTLTGNWQKAGESLNVRCTTVFSDAGHTMTANWDYSIDGSKWQRFMDAQATKGRSPISTSWRNHDCHSRNHEDRSGVQGVNQGDAASAHPGRVDEEVRLRSLVEYELRAGAHFTSSYLP